MRRLLPSRKIRWKIIGPYAVLALLLAFLGTYLVTNIVTSSLEERFTNQLAEAARVAADSLVRRERQHLEVARSVAFTEGVAEAVAAAGEAEAASDEQTTITLERLVLPLVANSGTETVEVLDLAGRPLYAVRLADRATLSYEPVADASTRAGLEPVQRVLATEVDDRGDKFAGFATVEGRPMFYTAGPIVTGGELVGVVLVGSTLESFLPVVKGEALADVTFYDQARAPLSSTFPVEEGLEADLGPRLPGGQLAAGLREQRQLFGRQYELLYGELRIRDEPVGVYSIALPTSFITSANETTSLQLGALFAAVTVAVLLVGWMLARLITKPLLRLVNTARAVAAGDLTARSGVRTGDEIGVLAVTFDAMTEKLERQHLGTIRALVSAIDARDPYTRGHSVRVGHLAQDLGKELRLDDRQLQQLLVGGYLHDIGKIGVRDAILLKPSALTNEERALIEQHPTIGLEILASVELPRNVIDIVGGHHEKLDGSGYPLAFSAEELTIFPRIAAVADIYDALVSDRPYRAGMEMRRALEILAREAETGLLDPQVVVPMHRLAPQWEQRRHDDPELQGMQLESPLVVPFRMVEGGATDHDPAHLHPHPGPPLRHSA